MVVERFFYDACVLINVVNSFYFTPMLDAIFVICLGYKGSTYLQLWFNNLKDAKKEVQLLVNSYCKIWVKIGCIIMGDVGQITNNEHCLLSSRNIVCEICWCFEYCEWCNYFVYAIWWGIEWVGSLNVVHVVTDNATNYVVLRRLIS